MEALSNIKFPVYKIGTYHSIETTALGRVYITTSFNKYLLDDKTVEDQRLFMRRLRTSSKLPLYPFKKTIFNLRSLIKEKGSTLFMDSLGTMFLYKKSSKRYNIVCKRIQSKKILNNGKIVITTEYPPFSEILMDTKANREVEYISYLMSDYGPLFYDVTKEYHEPYKRCF